jgi:hypothetical protein
MKKIVVFILTLLSTLCAFASNAQSNADQWRLVKSTWAMVGEPLERYEYKYDTAGRIIEYKNYRGKNLILTQKDFVYNNLGQITRYGVDVGNTDPYSHLMTYDQQGRLKSHEEIRHLANPGNGRPKDQIILTRNFSYSQNQMIEKKIRSSFGGKLIDETTYSLDSKGNFTKKTGVNLNSNVKSQDYIYGNYDTKENPSAFTGTYFLIEPQSRNAGGEGYWEGDTSATSSFTHNKDSLLSKMVITYTTSDGGKIHHTHEYTYMKFKP